jgi:hypothetical protein
LAQTQQTGLVPGGVLKRVLHSLRSLDQAIRLIDAAEIVAFDFDALITRRAASDDAVLNYVGFLLRQQDERLTGFVDRRKQAERAARMTLGQKKDLDRGLIYACFATDDVWSSTVIARACALEREMELGALAPRLDVVALVDYAAQVSKRTIVVSDTRLPRAVVMNVLETRELLQHFDYVYLSTERSPDADPAGFYAVVAAKEAVAPASMLLIADDRHSADDIPWPRDWECAAIATTDWRSLVLADSVANFDWRGELILTPFAKRIASSAYDPGRPGQVISVTTEHELGYVVFGSLLLAFMGWLCNVAALSNCDRLLCTSRQGYFLRDAYNRLRLRLRLDHLPEAEYVYISPRVVLAASQAIDFAPTRILAGISHRTSIADLLETRLGFRSSSSMPLATEVSLPEDSSYVEQILWMLEGEIVKQLEPRHAGFMAYLNNLDLDDDAVLGLVDLGATAVTQAALQELIGRPLLGLYLMSSAPSQSVGKIPEGLAFGCFQNDFYPESCDNALHSTLAEHVKLLDALFTAPHGEVSHFLLNAQGYTGPIFLDSGMAQKNFHRLKAVFSGAEAYCADALSSWGDTLLSALPWGHSAGLVTLQMLARGQIGLDEELAALLFTKGI